MEQQTAFHGCRGWKGKHKVDSFAALVKRDGDMSRDSEFS